MYGYIYMTTNLINGRRYIGKHRSSIFNPKYKGSGNIIKQALGKYGTKNFKVELIEECSTKEDLSEREKYWISYYDAVNSQEFYNLGKGGEGWQVVLRGEDHPMYGRRGENSPLYGHEVTQETREKISKKARGRVWINNGEYELTINCQLLESYLLQGYERGRLPSSRDSLVKSLKGNQIAQGRIWINNGKEEVMIYPKDFTNYSGYVKGRLLSSRPFGNTVSKGRIHVTNGVVNRSLLSEEVDKFLEENPEFYKGITSNRSKEGMKDKS